MARQRRCIQIRRHKRPDNVESCPNLRFIGVLATGYNIVDIRAAGDAGIIVSNIPSYGTDAVAQYAIALLLELCHHVASILTV